MKLSEAKRDHYRRRAHREGYVSRASYKLLDIQKRFGIIQRGDTVIDFGCSPGGWLQVASSVAGDQSLIVGVDLKPPRLSSTSIMFLQGDIAEDSVYVQIEAVLKRKADVVLSDVAPNISGIWELDHNRQIMLTSGLLQQLPRILKSGGTALFKVFEGDQLQELTRECRRMFLSVKLIKPPASRPSSSELYILCREFQLT
jgi:23S rRNA (uridine2552-2'-O)-methyltransferase